MLAVTIFATNWYTVTFVCIIGYVPWRHFWNMCHITFTCLWLSNQEVHKMVVESQRRLRSQIIARLCFNICSRAPVERPWDNFQPCVWWQKQDILDENSGHLQWCGIQNSCFTPKHDCPKLNLSVVVSTSNHTISAVLLHHKTENEPKETLSSNIKKCKA